MATFCRNPVSALKIVVLPEFGFPARATVNTAPAVSVASVVVWQEDIGGGRHAVFVSRLVGGNHFELFNSGQPISNTVNDATRPDITFSGNIPYISWQEEVSGEQVTFVGHFEGGASAPVFKLDTPTGIANSGFGDVANPLRAPISSGCTANPTNADGSTCQGGAAGTPFFLYTAGSAGSQKLFAQAYAPSEVSTLAPTDIGNTEATLDGSVNPGGSAIKTHFEFGPTTAYGSTTPDARLDAASVVTSFDATATDLTPGATVHRTETVMPGMWDCHGHFLGTRKMDISQLPVEAVMFGHALRGRLSAAEFTGHGAQSFA